MSAILKTAFATLMLLSLSFATPAQAQSKKELAAQNAALAERLTRLESRMLTGDPAAERLMARIDALEGAQRALRGELERVTFERDGLKGEVSQLRTELQIIQDMAGRMKVHLDAVDLIAQEQTRPIQRRTGPVQLGPTTPLDPLGGAPEFSEQPLVIGQAPTLGRPPILAQPPFKDRPLTSDVPNDVADLGQKGKRLLTEGDFGGAQIALSQYLQFNPDAADVGEMQYWLGESYYVRGGFADAADAYITSMKRDPRGEKAPDAMVRLAGALRQLGKPADACATLASFPSQYPRASAAVKEKARVEAARASC